MRKEVDVRGLWLRRSSRRAMIGMRIRRSGRSPVEWEMREKRRDNSRAVGGEDVESSKDDEWRELLLCDQIVVFQQGVFGVVYNHGTEHCWVIDQGD